MYLPCRHPHHTATHIHSNCRSRPARRMHHHCLDHNFDRHHRRCHNSAAAAAQPASQHIGARQEWHRDDLHVVLVHPQIPQNTGNVARTCAATAVPLHLVGPIGFSIEDAKLKRAGLDYWPSVCCMVHEDWEAFASFWEQQPGPKRLVAFSKFGRQHYAAPGGFVRGDWLLFGAETSGLPPEVCVRVCSCFRTRDTACMQAHAASEASGAVVKIPINDTHVRSLNLASSVGIGLYEAIRQLDPPSTDLLPPVEGAPMAAR